MLIQTIKTGVNIEIDLINKSIQENSRSKLYVIFIRHNYSLTEDSKIQINLMFPWITIENLNDSIPFMWKTDNFQGIITQIETIETEIGMYVCK